MSVRVTLDVDVRSRLAAQARALGDALDEVVHDTADFVRDAARESMVGSGGGRVYVRYGVPHVASAPGRPPAIWTGQLFASIHTENHGLAHYSVDASAPYAEYLEYGTSTPMAPRPFMRPAARKGRSYARAKGGVTVRLAMASAPW